VSRSEPVIKTQDEDRPALFSKPSVLVIDDEKRIRDVCISMLTGEGHEVAGAENAEVGIRMIKNKHFDIILLDLMMPGISGLDALVQIRATHPDTVVIVITGYATLEHSVEAMKKGAFDFISKPFSPGDLLMVINKAVEHFRTLQDIATEKSRMRVMINQLADGVMTTDNQKRIAQANPAFLKMIGFHGPRPIGESVDAVVSSRKLNSMIDRVLDAPKDELIEVSEEVCLETGEKSAEIIIGAHCVPFRDRLGRNLGTITVLHDITALKKMDQMKSDFVSMVSHEIRSPMNSVLMQLKVVLDGLAGTTTAKQREILGRASEKINGLNNMATELLDLARIESGLIAREREAVQIDRLLADQVAFHQARSREKSIRLTLGQMPALPVLTANRFNLEEVFSNLISNAISYTPASGRITIEAAIEGDYVCIRVMDTGMGIAMEDRDRIFDRFYRVKNEQTRYIVGTGLGLPIVKSIVDAHHGQIRVDSEPGCGTTFSIFLPLGDSLSTD
jgi:two-component system phosphate regulon sensor histidine kinase PhoR